MSEYDHQLLRKLGVVWHRIAAFESTFNPPVYSEAQAARKRIDASRVTLAIQDPHIGTVRSLQSLGRWQLCEYIDGIDAPQDVIGDCVAIDETLRQNRARRGL